MADPKVDALRETLQKYESGELRSDLFGGDAATGSNSSDTAAGAPASGPTSGDEYSKARATVLRKLTGSPKSRHQLAEALQDKEFSADVITSVLDRMEEVLLIDDVEFARSWVRTRHEMKGLGSAALRNELQDKGITKETIEVALEQLSVEDEDAAARELVEGKLRGVTIPVGNGPEDRKEREKITRRLVGMLGRRGHSPGAAFQLVREAMEERSA
ncbi:regulatory protein RecX [Nesterenkonia natronophila]|uniref:Regulatory protein RecX n=1 Tax=Nesterenkonia natronophila TaxID=2174932 RepID=A0A3A4F5J1_9MICC|nr:regulatory protein RecX [Nesterenkonia natronophila]RJN33021.1 regulatory protein RecX [Nesterenkonia natronophila]